MIKTRKNTGSTTKLKTSLRAGDLVMVIAGGNKDKGESSQKGKVGKILRFIPSKARVVVEGVNLIKRHKRARSASEGGGIIEREGSIHISNVMYYHQESGRPVRLCKRILEEGKKVRGFTNPSTKQFEQIDVA